MADSPSRKSVVLEHFENTCATVTSQRLNTPSSWARQLPVSVDL